MTVEFGTDRYRAMAAAPDGDEYEKLWAEVVEQAPGCRIPVVVLRRLDAESRVPRALVSGGGTVRIARALNVSPATASGHVTARP
ncbi:hypothetical protein AB0M88_14505, partial [Actinoplanes sp. NPDC051411]